MADDLDPTLALLQSAFDDPRFDDLTFIDWVYNHNPVGPLVPADIDVDGTRISHIGGVPVELRARVRAGVGHLLLNSSTEASSRGRGVYVENLNAARANGRAAGALNIFGVTNDQSTGPVVKYFKGRHVMSLPVKVCIPTWVRSRNVESRTVDADYLASEEFVALASELDAYPVENWTYRWTPDFLRWRLSWPRATYAIHVTPDLVAVSVRRTPKRLPVAVILKVLPRGVPAGKLSARPVVNAICGFHRTPFVLYAGVNTAVAVPGPSFPRRYLPAPLNLVWRSCSPDFDEATEEFDVFELLDFDPF